MASPFSFQQWWQKLTPQQQQILQRESQLQSGRQPASVSANSQPRGGGGFRMPPVPQASAASQIANAVDRARASQTGGPGRPLTLPHDWSGFEKEFAPVSPEDLAARHPNIQSTANPPPATGATASPDINSAGVQAQLDAARGGPTAEELTARARLPANQTMVRVGDTTIQPGIQTPFGQIAVHNVPRGTPEPTAAQTAQDTTAAGVVHPATPTDWQQQVMKNHPDIGVAGSDANKAFIAAYKDAQAKGGQFDPMALAKSTMDNVQTQRDKAEQSAQEKTASDVMGQAQQQQTADAAAAAKAASAKKATAAETAENTRTFTSNTPLGNAEDVVRAVPSLPGKVAAAATSAGQAIESELGIKPGAGPAPVLPSQLQSMPGQGKEAAKAMGLTRPDLSNMTPGQLAKNEEFANQTLAPAPQPAAVADTTPPPPTDSTVPNMASGYGTDAEPQSSGESWAPDPQTQFPHDDATTHAPTPTDNAVASAWKGDMQSAEGALKNADNQFAPGTSIMTEQLAGPAGPMATIPGTVRNYATGRAFRFGGPMERAMNREKAAIAHHVGGARRGDKPEPVNLPGVGPAVINTGEKVVPNAAGGAEVLTRRMQRKPFQFRPR